MKAFVLVVEDHFPTNTMRDALMQVASDIYDRHCSFPGRGMTLRLGVIDDIPNERVMFTYKYMNMEPMAVKI